MYLTERYFFLPIFSRFLHIRDVQSLPTLAIAQKAFPKLNISKDQTYILFDNSSVVHKSKNLKELTCYLADHQPK
jgi:hypothetical protein